MDTENRAVVRIFSWYVTWRKQGEKIQKSMTNNYVLITKRITRSHQLLELSSWITLWVVLICTVTSRLVNPSSAVPGRWLHPGWTERRTAGCSAGCRSLKGSPASVFLWVCEQSPGAWCCLERACCNLRNENKHVREQDTHSLATLLDPSVQSNVKD